MKAGRSHWHGFMHLLGILSGQRLGPSKYVLDSTFTGIGKTAQIEASTFPPTLLNVSIRSVAYYYIVDFPLGALQMLVAIL